MLICALLQMDYAIIQNNIVFSEITVQKEY